MDQRLPVRHPVRLIEERLPVRHPVRGPGEFEPQLKRERHSRNLHLSIREQAAELFDRVLQNGTSPDGQPAILEAVRHEHYPSAFEYKGRLLREASVLQMAMWMEATRPQKKDYSGLVLKLVRAGIDTSQRAVYVTVDENGREQISSLHTIVIASGLGNTEILDALAEGMGDQNFQELLNREDLATKNGKFYYCALHEACFLGKSHAVIWLLEHGASAEKPNADKKPSLHLFIKAITYDGSEEDVKKSLKKLVRAGWTLTTEVPYSDGQVTALELATQHDANFPKKLIYLLSPGFNSLKPNKFKSDVPRDLSLIDDLLLLARTSPTAADVLAKEIFTAGSEHRRSRVRDHLIHTMQRDRHGVLKLAGVMCAAPRAATDILALLTRHPQIQDPTHYPLRNRTLLKSWRTLGRAVNLLSVYSADALRNPKDILEPTWFYNIDERDRERRYPSWHDQLIPRVHDMHDRQNQYDVQTSVLMAPNLLTLDMMKALTTVQDVEIFQTKAVTGLVDCPWRTFASAVNAYEILFIALFEMGPLLGWGLSVGQDGELFDRLWKTPSDEKRNLSHNSPANVPLIWSILAGVWLKWTIRAICWIVAYTARWYVSQDRDPLPWLGFFNVRFSERHGRDTNTGIWPFAQILDNSVLPFTLLEIFLLGKLMWHTAGFTGCYDDDGKHHETICYDEQALLSASLFLCAIRMVYMLRSFTACGPRVLAIVNTFFSGAMMEMMFIMAFAFLCFMWVLSSLRRQHTFGWEGIYLYRGLVFGDGDGLDRLGLNSESSEASESEGDPAQHAWVTFYGVILTIIFNLVFMNLIIAIYGDEYNEQQTNAPLYFLHNRACVMVRMMMTYYSLGRVFPFALHFNIWVELFLLWVFAVFVAKSNPCYITCFGNALLFTLWQLCFFVFIAHFKYAPPNMKMKKTGVDCQVLHAEIAGNKMLEVRVSIDCKIGQPQEWHTALKTSALLASDSVIFDGLKPVHCHARGTMIVFDDRIGNNGADNSQRYEATLGFALETHHEQVLTLSFETPSGEPGSVQFLVSRFVWICYRDDFNDSRFGKGEREDIYQKKTT